MPRRALSLSLGLIALAVYVMGASAQEPSSIFEAVDANDPAYVARWLKAGGNPNLLSTTNESLLYLATGPHGGNEVLALLLKSCADPDLGAYDYTPLMNAASWVNLPAVESLLAYGADPQQRNEKGQTAIEVVGLAGGNERPVIARLRQSIQHAPNPSIERTCPGKPGPAAHVKRVGP